MKKLFPIFLFFALLPSVNWAAINNLADCNRTTVANALAAASTGDEVVCPSGTYSTGWSSGLTVPDGVTFKGAGKTSTIIDSSAVITINVGDNSVAMDYKITNGSTWPSDGAQQFAIIDVYMGNETSAYRIIYIGASVSGIYPTEAGVFHGCTFENIRAVVDGAHLGLKEWGSGHSADWGGTTYPVYFEDCTWAWGASVSHSQNHANLTDGNRGGQGVFRFNAFGDDFYILAHGTRPGVSRGPRTREIYFNTFTMNDASTAPYAIRIRGGPAIVFWNTCATEGNTTATDCRYMFGDTGWDTGRTTYPCYNATYDTSPHPDTGINYGCRDMFGMGQDDTDYGTASGGETLYYNDQAYDPVYWWNNTIDGVDSIEDNVGDAQEDRDYFTSAGNGGVSWGLWANRPACGAGNPHDGYWATDRGGDWCLDGEAKCDFEVTNNDGALYKCDGVDTWELHYKPADYPHTLVTATESGADLSNAGVTISAITSGTE